MKGFGGGWERDCAGAWGRRGGAGGRAEDRRLGRDAVFSLKFEFDGGVGRFDALGGVPVAGGDGGEVAACVFWAEVEADKSARDQHLSGVEEGVFDDAEGGVKEDRLGVVGVDLDGVFCSV